CPKRKQPMPEWHQHLLAPIFHQMSLHIHRNACCPRADPRKEKQESQMHDRVCDHRKHSPAAEENARCQSTYHPRRVALQESTRGGHPDHRSQSQGNKNESQFTRRGVQTVSYGGQTRERRCKNEATCGEHRCDREHRIHRRRVAHLFVSADRCAAAHVRNPCTGSLVSSKTQCEIRLGEFRSELCSRLQ